MWRSRRAGSLAVLMALAVAGCGGTAKPARTFTYADRGRVVTLAKGQRALVKLDSLNWTFLPIAGRALRAVAPQRLGYVIKGCREDSGCGWVELTVQAVARGRGVIEARRGSCGEAERCPPDLRDFAVTVAVR